MWRAGLEEEAMHELAREEATAKAARAAARAEQWERERAALAAARRRDWWRCCQSAKDVRNEADGSACAIM